MSEQLSSFFASGPFTDHSPVVKVLKCINQEIIYPAVMSIRSQLYEKFPYKDVKSGWRVSIVLDNDNIWSDFFLLFSFFHKKINNPIIMMII